MTNSLPPSPCDLLVLADVIITQDDARTVISNGAVAVTGGLVDRIGPRPEMERAYAPADRLDLGGCMLMPGLVNGHTHLPMTLFRGFADDMPLMEWLEEHIWPVEFQLTEEMLGIGAALGCAELIRTGCTAFLNGYFHEQVTGDAASTAGLRAVLGEGFFSFPSPMFPTAQACWQTIRELHARYADNPLVTTAVTPHAAFTVNPEELAESFELACELDTPWQIHLAESPAETAVCVEKYGRRPLDILHERGLLTRRTVLHHGVDLDAREIAIVARTGARVVHNPVSNLKLCSGIAPVQAMLDAGVTVGLGTDGAASNNQLNMFRDLSYAALLGKLRHGNAAAMSAQSVLDMATRGSAACLGQPGLGRIEAGHPADMIALDLSGPNMQPAYNHVSLAVYSATGMEVCMTMVAGTILYLFGDFRTIDVKSLQAKALRASRWVVSQAGK
ncbi:MULTISPECIES: amidohydrolase family protein [Pseudodesulfovibrio]|uniref:S-adenosylhomocysteine deaminase n=1 Tax=Pseudodesulfovibrio aespoeensis (strain ATCC 700646 / DSM 10631 / Aspo-2) TaxID=643562 RepID=E6VWK7_PSEA9|nr:MULTISPECIES: amidohydrolase [Pseudodesulfovibrio]ADU62508.1 S-adenosylhomocysteine deaminase [Pseudodesulfovibrio aespoeensis Aspo-2]MCG2731542.1 amidohydrolase [Pseudodesulfovibrio aespoeensis]